MNTKIIITGIKNINKLQLAKEIVKINDNLTICPKFISDPEYSGIISENYKYYLPTNIVNLSYKNNSIFFIKTENFISSGVTTDDFENNDIVFCDLNEYNNISDKYFNEYNILTIWLDTKYHKNINIIDDLNEIKYFENRLENNKYMYFLDEDIINTASIINEYLITNNEELLNSHN